VPRISTKAWATISGVVVPRKSNAHFGDDCFNYFVIRCANWFPELGPKTSFILSPQVVDSRHSIFAGFAAQNHMSLLKNQTNGKS
jgi:hypothetical protein